MIEGFVAQLAHRLLRSWEPNAISAAGAGDTYAENKPMSSDLTNDDGPGFLEEIQEPYEPLRKELRKYLEKSRWGYFIRHPFCNDMIHDLDYCSHIHQRIDRWTAQADECFENQDWEGYLGNIDINSQPEWFDKDKELFSDEQYWRLLGRVYGCQKFTHDRRDLFDELFRSERPGRENLMDAEEREIFARLPDEFVVYRGYSEDVWLGYTDGIAWTLDRRHAVWYANWNRELENVRVITGRVRKADIWAYLEGGDILLPPENVFTTQNRRAWSEKARAAFTDFIKKPFDIEAWLRKANSSK